MSVTKQPAKDDIAYLKQDAPVFEITIPELRAKFNQQNPLLSLNEYKIITNHDIASLLSGSNTHRLISIHLQY